ncbi:MAG: hypothetical protein KF799_01165 [Bdellovibrionales bacterium]|nr:hypothetical protein [Bdellovibrionales bacterium]
MIPLGVGFVIASNSWIVFHIVDRIYPLYSMEGAQLANETIAAMRFQQSMFYWHLALFMLIPPLLSAVIGFLLLNCWTCYSRQGRGRKPSWLRQPLHRLRYRVGDAVGRLFVNYMAELTAHDERASALMADILDDKDTLYSGIYREYHTEDGKLASISLSNVICFGFHSEKDRRESKASDDGKYIPYILPNQGDMCFPIQKIQNFHFWKINDSQEFLFDIHKPAAQVRAAWYAGLKYSLADKITMNVTAIVPKEDTNLENFVREFKKLRLEIDDIDYVNPDDSDGKPRLQN